MPGSTPIAKGDVKHAHKEGWFSGAYICDKGHVVLVVIDEQERPIIEIHMDAKDREMMAEVLRDTKPQ